MNEPYKHIWSQALELCRLCLFLRSGNARLSVAVMFPIVVLLLTSPCAKAAEYIVQGHIVMTRIHSQVHSITAARGIMLFTMNVSLSANCLLLWIPVDDRVTQSVLMAAHAQDALVTVRYADPGSPWGDSQACAVTAIDY